MMSIDFRISMKTLIFLIATALLVSGCTSKKQSHETNQVISVQVNESQNTDIVSTSSKIIQLENESDNLIGAVKRVFLIDSVFYIYHGQKMSRYDMYGNFMGDISHSGRGPKEYLTLWYCWEQDQSVFLYDLNGSKILIYNSMTDVLSEKTIEDQERRFQAIIPFGNGYVGKMGYDGTNKGDELGFFDGDYSFINTIGQMKLHSGLWLGNPFVGFDEKEVLYWRQLENDIYAIRSDSTISIKYTIDFIEKNVPERDFADEYEKIDFINTDPNAYATFLSNVVETEGQLFFTFLFQAKKHLAIFDKVTRQTKIYHFTLPEEQTLNEIIPLKDGILVITDTLNENSTIYVLDFINQQL
jgi:hypothetical protein